MFKATMSLTCEIKVLLAQSWPDPWCLATVSTSSLTMAEDPSMIERATEPMMCPAARVSSSLGRLATPPGFCRGILKPDNWENWELEDLCVEDFWEHEPRELAWEKIREARSYSLELRSFEGLRLLDLGVPPVLVNFPRLSPWVLFS